MTFSERNEDFIYEAISYIEHDHDTSKIKKIYMLGDCAIWINNLKYYFNYFRNITIILGLDHFHFKQAIWRIYPQKDVYNTILSYILNNNNKDFNRILDEIMDLKPERKEKINKYKNYFSNNWNKINNLIHYNLSCLMESQISHTFTPHFTSRLKGYNKNMITKLINIRLKKKSSYNIKELYLKNLNQNIVINLNETQLNYSLFDKKKTYSVLIKSTKYF